MGTGDARNLIVWGASGHAKVLVDALAESYTLVALFDNDPQIMNPFPTVPIYTGMLGFEEWMSHGHGEGACYVLAIGGDKGRDRLSLHAMLDKRGLLPLTVIHPRSFVAGSASLGAGCQILAGAAVCVDAHLGVQTIVNTNATVDHECEIGMGVHIAPGATITGCVQLGNFVMIGAGAVVLPRRHIGADSVIGAGSVVTNDIPDNVIAYGNPARVVRSRERCHV